jgi:hypothetical protein
VRERRNNKLMRQYLIEIEDDKLSEITTAVLVWKFGVNRNYARNCLHDERKERREMSKTEYRKMKKVT